MVLAGGLERMTFEILRVVRDKGGVVHCIVNGWDHSRIVAMAERLGASWSIGYYWYRFTRRTTNPLTLARIVWDTLCTSGGLLRDAWWFGASHIFVSDYVTALRNAPALMLLKLGGRRIIMRLGNAPDQGRFFRYVWRFGINPFVDVFVCNSQFTERELAAHGVAAAKRLTIAHTPPERRTARPVVESQDTQRIIYVGQLIPEKGTDLLLDAVGLLVGRGRDVRVDVVGTIGGWVPPKHAGYHASLIARAGEPDLRGRVQFLGDREDVPHLMRTAAIHCCPSRKEQREAFGIVVIEAKQAGIPSVVMPSGALAELIVHGEDGWVCREETAEALAEGLEYFLDPDRLAHAMTAARRSASAFSRDRFEQAWGAIFLKAS